MEDVQESWGELSTGQGRAYKVTRRTERLLLQRKEDGVKELDVFKYVVDEVIKLEPLRDIQKGWLASFISFITDEGGLPKSTRPHHKQHRKDHVSKSLAQSLRP